MDMTIETRNGASEPVGRLAPSPTGELHLGHARSFLLAWWHARAAGGRVVLRIEDLDRDRAKPELADGVLRDLAWLGLDWDGPPCFQAADELPYRAAAERLLASGQAYACTCSRRDVLEALDAPHAGGELRYPGTCRGRWPDVETARRATGAPPGIRFRVAAGAVDWHDAFLGDQRHDPAAEVGDFLIARGDSVRGTVAWAYQLAVVVDDARHGITEVLRGDDLAPSAARQLLLQRALGLPHPTWIHVPLVVDETGRRLAKRDADLTLAQLRQHGVDARTVVAWAATSAGLAVPRSVRARDVLADFDLARLPAAPVVVGPEARAALYNSSDLAPKACTKAPRSRIVGTTVIDSPPAPRRAGNRGESID